MPFIKILFIASMIVLSAFSDSLFSDPITGKTAQEMIARLDQTINLGQGLVRANLTLIKRSGDSTTWKVNIFRNKDDSLYLFERGGRGLEAKILFKDEGDRVFLYNANSAKIFQKNEEEKFEPHFTTGFSFIDLSGYSYQVNYNPIILGNQDISGKSYLRVSLKPILGYSYKKLVLLFENPILRPTRIDFHDKDGVLFKTLNFKYSKLRIKSKNITSEVEFPSRLEMLDLNTGGISVLEYLDIDRDVIPDKSLFESANLNK
ncbi:MAG: outer membrane lipoprotein-sorting protein [Leptospiraceae bacterium]|nr:outer membrane lipoprotein-sorting protein [Leptospiraceae bacterium]NUM41406.1 outer membrane lipoprotein-sorting protein [Leptospiraceae bacterium]